MEAPSFTGNTGNLHEIQADFKAPLPPLSLTGINI